MADVDNAWQSIRPKRKLSPVTKTGMMMISGDVSIPNCAETSSTSGHRARNVKMYQPFKCKVCSMSFKFRLGLTKHEQKMNHHLLPGDISRENESNSSVTSSTDKSTKDQSRKRNQRGIFICPDCNNHFGTSDKWSRHVQTKCGKNKPFKCERCEARFSTATTLNVHVTSIHEKGIKEHLCRFCGNGYLSRGQLKVHERSHTGEKPFKCDKCPKSFAYRESLVTHASVHTGIKPYICEGCFNRFSCIGNLIKHRRLRPDSCGLPKFNRNTKCAPRASGKSKNTSIADSIKAEDIDAPPNVDIRDFDVMMPSNSSNICIVQDGFSSQSVSGDPLSVGTPVEHQNYMSEEDVVMNIEIEYVSPIADDKEEVETSEVVEFDFDMHALPDGSEEYGDDWPESGEYVQEIGELTKYVDTDDDALMGVPEFLEDDPEFDEEYSTIENEPIDEESTPVQDDEMDRKPFDGNNTKNDDEGSEQYVIDLPSNCVLCNHKFETKSKYVEHLRLEHNIVTEKDVNRSDRTVCTICSLRFAKVSSMKSHLTVHGPDGSLVHKCACCPAWFATVDARSTHQLAEHHSQPAESKTSVMNTITVTPLCIVPQDSETVTMDESCTQTEPTDPIAVDIYTIHTSAKLPRQKKGPPKKYVYMCLKCGRKFQTRMELTDHEESECGAKPKHRCAVCKKGFYSAGSLKTHMSIHTGELPHACQFCEKKFRTQGQVKVHERKHNGDKPFKCEFCNKGFGYRESLLTHISTHTKIKRFLCPCCGSRFSCISNLKAHRRSHSTTCGKSPQMTKAVICPISQL